MAYRISPLITDQYQLSMAYSYFLTGVHNDSATFEMFFRKNPFKGEYAIFAGMGQLMEFVVNFGFTDEELAFVEKTIPNMRPEFIQYLKGLNYLDLTIRAPQEGQMIFANEPVLQISGPLGFV